MYSGNQTLLIIPDQFVLSTNDRTTWQLYFPTWQTSNCPWTGCYLYEPLICWIFTVIYADRHTDGNTWWLNLVQGSFDVTSTDLKILPHAYTVLTDTRKYDHFSPILHELGCLTVKELLCLWDTTMIYKCLNGLTPSYLSSKLTECSKNYGYSTRSRDQLRLTKCHTAIAQRLFYYRAVASWKSLTGQTRNSTSIQFFKKEARVEISCA